MPRLPAFFFTPAVAALIVLASCTMDTAGPQPVDDVASGTDAHDAVVTADGPAARDDAPTPPSDTSPPATDAGCNVSACGAGVATTCDHSTVLQCSSFGGACATFEGDDGGSFGWCGCGPVAEGGGRCLDGRNAVLCESGLAQPAECPVGTTCGADPTSPGQIGCACDNRTDGVCPQDCDDDPDCAHCVPQCTGHACGSNGCGGSCGSCAVGQTCTSAGACVASCTPSCTGHTCGSDGCGGSCGTCASGMTCNAGRCASTCTPSCTGRVCGGDGCGGPCGTACTAGLECASDGSHCECSFFATNSYAFDASSIAWSHTSVVHVFVTQTGELNTSNDPRDFVLTTTMPMNTIRFYGCRPDVRVQRVYYSSTGHACDVGTQEVTGRTAIAIPDPTWLADGTCTAPRL